MLSSDILQYATLATAVAAVFGVIFAMFSHRRQVNASIYLDLSERLHRLFQSLPVEMRSAHLAGKEPDPSHAAVSLVIVVDFLHLMHSAHTLYKSGYFSGRLWVQLRTQAEQGLQLPLFRQYWPGARREFSGSPAFIAFVEKTQRAR